jgi:uncharacterized RmlC-like cupin family protein
MRGQTKLVLVLGLLLSLIPFAAPAASAAERDDGGKIVIVFKDGHQQSFRLADIARIEFSQPTAGAPAGGMARFLGQWKVGDGAGGTFLITLKPDGKAHKTIGSGHDGTWTVVGGEARITWEDGWHDAIRKAGRKFQKVAFSPGASFSDQSANVADAELSELSGNETN